MENLSTCNCDGTVSQSASDYFGALTNWSDVFGGVAPDTQQVIACRNAVARLQAFGVEGGCQPGDGDPGNILDNLYQDELGNVSHVVATEPVSNPIQRGVDVAVGTASPNVQIAPSAKPASSNTAFIAGAILILGVGFILVFR